MMMSYKDFKLRKDLGLRDWYAGMAMQALISLREGVDNGTDIAKDAFEMSEIMMAQRSKEWTMVDE
jgi:hypothetical protein